MKQTRQMDDSCRRVLIQALVAGIFSSAGGAAAQQVLDPAPQELPCGRSFYHVSGRVLVNDRLATLQTPIKRGDTVESGSNGKAVFLVGSRAYILCGEGRLVVEAQALDSPLASAFRVVTGALLAALGAGGSGRTSTVTIGIRD